MTQAGLDPLSCICHIISCYTIVTLGSCCVLTNVWYIWLRQWFGCISYRLTYQKRFIFLSFQKSKLLGSPREESSFVLQLHFGTQTLPTLFFHLPLWCNPCTPAHPDSSPEEVEGKQLPSKYMTRKSQMPLPFHSNGSVIT